jgi:hypothetical protein
VQDEAPALPHEPSVGPGPAGTGPAGKG